MGKAFLLILEALLILISAGWVSLWLLKPTEFWTKKWRAAEEKAGTSVFGYNGLDFAVYTFPVIALAIVGLIYLDMKTRATKSRRGRKSITSLTNPFVVNSYIGILSIGEILAVLLFLIFLAWTFYARISNDFKKMIPVKSFRLSLWQYKMFRVATRFGLLAEACLALLLLPILRRMAIFQLLGIQFEASVRYHIWLGTAMVFFATIHGAGTYLIWGLNHRIQEEMWKWQKTGRIYLAGEIALAAGLAMWITSLPQLRRKQFEVFYYTHHLYVVFITFFLFHTGDRHFYMVFPGIILFGLDKVLRIIQSRPQTCIVSAWVFPCKAMELVLPKDTGLKYKPTSVIFIKIPKISKFQWHCFSITSSSRVDDKTLSIIIRTEGWWTKSLYEIIHADTDSQDDQKRCVEVAIEGPYGPASLNFLRYDSLFLVAGGIGITPLLSILQEITSEQSNSRNKYPERVQLIYCIKKSQDVCLLTPVLHRLLRTKQIDLKIEVFVTQEEECGKTLREVFDEFSQVKTVNFNTECATYAASGFGNSLVLAAILGLSCIIFLVSLCFFNHFFHQPAKRSSKQKNPSSETDLLLLCSFTIVIVCSALIAIMVRQKRRGKELQSFSDKQLEAINLSSIGADLVLEEHKIHFGGRPNFQELFPKFSSETGGSDIGVLVCGPETMKQSVASACLLHSKTCTGAQQKKPYFNFQSLNFTL